MCHMYGCYDIAMSCINTQYDGRFVMLTNSTDHISMDVFRPHGEWDVVGTTSVAIAQEFESDPGVLFPTVRFSLYLSRKPRFYIINIVMPCVLLSALALFVFYALVLRVFMSLWLY